MLEQMQGAPAQHHSDGRAEEKALGAAEKGEACQTGLQRQVFLLQRVALF